MKYLISGLISINRYFILLEKALLITLLFSMVALSFSQVVARNFFSAGFLWIDHVLRLEVLWIAFLGAALATAYNQHIKIDFLASIIRSDLSNKIIGVGAHLFSFIVCCLLFIVASYYVLIVSSDSTSTMISGIPDWAFQCIIPYCFFMMTIRSIINIIRISYKKDSPGNR